MNRYLLFAFREYYPSGGMEDLYGNYDAIDKIKEGIKSLAELNQNRRTINVLDTKTMKYTDTYEVINYDDGDKYIEIVDNDEINSLIKELEGFNNLKSC